ncbi:hypothetical protein F5Y17DRAFT_426739 [Xylariaceae sp. FL0594]|nr:hypothetical protein F5Y17DRAFT_426739 [Xylariaceae sp. FL0594]
MSGSVSPRRSRADRVLSLPWKWKTPTEWDSLESIGLPSKGDNRLLNFDTQEHYYTKIIEEFLNFCADAGHGEELMRRFAWVDALPDIDSLPPPSPRPRRLKRFIRYLIPRDGSDPLYELDLADSSSSTTLQNVLSALRKLREGIVASKRADDFAIQAYLFAIRTCVLAKHPESYHPAILHLLRQMHPRHPMTTLEYREVVSYLVLDTACRRYQIAEAYALRHRYHLKDPNVDAVLDALAHDDYVKFFRLKQKVDGHVSRLLEYADKEVRMHALKCFGQTYLTVDLPYLETCTGSTWDRLVAEDGVGWELEGTKVIIRRVKAK